MDPAIAEILRGSFQFTDAEIVVLAQEKVEDLLRPFKERMRRKEEREQRARRGDGDGDGDDRQDEDDEDCDVGGEEEDDDDNDEEKIWREDSKFEHKKIYNVGRWFRILAVCGSYVIKSHLCRIAAPAFDFIVEYGMSQCTPSFKTKWIHTFVELLDTLSGLCCAHKGNKEIVGQSENIIKNLEKFLKVRRLKRPAASLAWSLCYGIPKNQRSIAQSNCIPCLVRMIIDSGLTGSTELDEETSSDDEMGPERRSVGGPSMGNQNSRAFSTANRFPIQNTESQNNTASLLQAENVTDNSPNSGGQIQITASSIATEIFTRMPNVESSRAKKIRMRKEQERDAAVGAIWHLATLPENRESLAAHNAIEALVEVALDTLVKTQTRMLSCLALATIGLAPETQKRLTEAEALIAITNVITKTDPSSFREGLVWNTMQPLLDLLQPNAPRESHLIATFTASTVAMDAPQASKLRAEGAVPLLVDLANHPNDLRIRAFACTTLTALGVDDFAIVSDCYKPKSLSDTGFTPSNSTLLEILTAVGVEKSLATKLSSEYTSLVQLAVHMDTNDTGELGECKNKIRRLLRAWIPGQLPVATMFRGSPLRRDASEDQTMSRSALECESTNTSVACDGMDKSLEKSEQVDELESSTSPSASRDYRDGKAVIGDLGLSCEPMEINTTDSGSCDSCIICDSVAERMVFVPCGHAVACNQCCGILLAEGSAGRRCPICRTRIDMVILPRYA